jgi:hypothetical protein
LRRAAEKGDGVAEDLIPGVGAGTLLESELLADDRSIRIGAIHRLDYGEAIVITHDKWKFDAGGIPQHCFLLATARTDDGESDDDEILLLRVEGTAALSLESDLHAVREEALRTALSHQEDSSPSAVLDVDLDPFTRNRVSFTALKCKILGTFYEDDVDGRRQLEYGADVDNFYATATYRVLKPVGEGLSAIASFLKPSPGDVELVRIGSVRYSATRRRAKASKQADAAVMVNIHDFIGTKTALIGMTRFGKSNTAKILTARTFVVSESRRARGEPPIGQLIFDPQGEYANPNTQDGTEIAAIGERHVRIFQFGAPAGAAHLRPLGINFFDPAQIMAAASMITAQLRTETTSGYVGDFQSVDFEDEPGNYGQTTRAERARLLLYACMAKAGFDMPDRRPGSNYPYTVDVVISASLQTALVTQDAALNGLQSAGRARYRVPGRLIVALVEAIIALTPTNQDARDFCDDRRWRFTEPIFTGATSNGQRVRGYRNLNPVRRFHDPSVNRNPAEEIYSELLEGRVVIVDLHLGMQEVVNTLSESIVHYILERQLGAFTGGAEPPAIQLLLEEAHNLFATERYAKDADIWVKLAKEAAKLNLGMTYATQEVSGVAHQVKANTANWVVAHLNNTQEVHELSKFYDFGSYADAIISSEDRGYVRLKARSSPYLVPVQIDRYDLELVNEARAAAGDEPLTPDGTDSGAGA